MKKNKENFSSIPLIDPHRKNRFIVRFTKGIEIEPYKITDVLIGDDYHFISIIEIKDNNPTLFKSLDISKKPKVSYQLDLLDEIGSSIEKYEYEGIIVNKYLKMSYSSAELLKTKLKIEIL